MIDFNERPAIYALALAGCFPDERADLPDRSELQAISFREDFSEVKNWDVESDTIGLHPADPLYPERVALDQVIPSKITFRDQTFKIDCEKLAEDLKVHLQAELDANDEFFASNVGLYATWLGELDLYKNTIFGGFGAMNINIDEFVDFVDEVMAGHITINGERFHFDQEGVLSSIRYRSQNGTIRREQILKLAHYLIQRGVLDYRDGDLFLAADTEPDDMIVIQIPDTPKSATTCHEVMHLAFDNDQELRSWIAETLVANLSNIEKNAILFMFLSEGGYDLDDKNASPVLLVDEFLAFSASHAVKVARQGDKPVHPDTLSLDDSLLRYLEFLQSRTELSIADLEKTSDENLLVLWENRRLLEENIRNEGFNNLAEMRDFYFNPETIRDNPKHKKLMPEQKD